MNIGIFEVVTKGQQALAVLNLLKPVLGENGEIIEAVTTIVGKVLVGAKFGATTYNELVEQLDSVIVEMDKIRADGGVTSDSFRVELAAIEQRGAKIDEIFARLTA